MTSVEIANIVGIVNFHRELDLESIAELLFESNIVSDINYSPEKHHWLQTRFNINEDSKYVSYYRSGTCAIVGCSSFEQLHQYISEINNVMEPVIIKEPTLEVKNLVCIGEVGQDINLENLAIAAGLELVEYEPEQFPGLIYRTPEIDAVLLVFASGKVVVTGITSLEAANHSFQYLTERLADWGIIE